jgi:hypothetical protein
MSLVNDALKRARLAQPANLAPAAGPSLRPVEASAKSGGVGMLMGGVIGCILLLAGTLLFMWSHSPVEVRARTMAGAATMQAAQAMPPSESIHASPTQAVDAAAPLIAQPKPATAVTQEVAAPVIPVEPAKPAFKLQSVFYVPNNPSAIINGKRVHVGSMISEARVTAIGRESATLVTATGEKKVLELPAD